MNFPLSILYRATNTPVSCVVLLHIRVQCSLVAVDGVNSLIFHLDSTHFPTESEKIVIYRADVIIPFLFSFCWNSEKKTSLYINGAPELVCCETYLVVYNRGALCCE
jgi:hypothetical protein